MWHRSGYSWPRDGSKAPFFLLIWMGRWVSHVAIDGRERAIKEGVTCCHANESLMRKRVTPFAFTSVSPRNRQRETGWPASSAVGKPMISEHALRFDHRLPRG